MSETIHTRRASGDPARGEIAGGAREARLARLSSALHDGAAGARTWAVLDGANVPGLVRAIESHGAESECLIAGALDPSMERVAPRLVALTAGGPFEEWVLARGWCRSWGVFLRSSAARRTLRNHLRALLSVRDPEGRELYFRYYDPRVLRSYLPTCTPDEVAQVFGPVASFATERPDGAVDVFTPGGRGVEVQTLAASEG